MSEISDCREHISKLQTLCRLCNEFIRDSKKKYQKVLYASEIIAIYGIDVKQENDETYPPFVCLRHSRLLYRYRETKGESLSNSNELKLTKPKVYFPPHTIGCEVCSKTDQVRGRPRKRKRTDDYDDAYQSTCPSMNTEFKSNFEEDISHKSTKPLATEYSQLDSLIEYMKDALSKMEDNQKQLVVDLLGNTNPAGHYKTVTNWVKEQSSHPTELPSCDLMNVFDNEQVIGKTWSIKPKNKIAISIITNKAFMELQSPESLQKKADLKPEKKLQLPKIKKDDKAENVNENETIQTSKLQSLINEMIDQDTERYSKMETDHYEQLYYCIDHAIDTVSKEQKQIERNFQDFIDDQVKKDVQDENYIKCEHCGALNGKRKLICTNCSRKDGLKSAKNKKKDGANDSFVKDQDTCYLIIFEEDENDDKSDITEVHSELTQFSHVKSNHDGRHEIILSDPVFCNPNSMITVARVLRKIGEENGIVRYGGNQRHWTFVCCDGLPYLIIKKLKEEAVVCAIEGCGHYEMNLMKSFFELNWTPALEHLCQLMGFESDAAKQFAKACKDHHKTWRLLLIFHLGTLQERKEQAVEVMDPQRCLQTKFGLPVCRNNKLLETIKDHSLSTFNIKSDKGNSRSLGIENGIIAYRILLRKTDYLGKKGDHVSISGMALDEGLVDFLKLSVRKRIHLLKTEFLGHPIQTDHYNFRHPVPVTPSEREKLFSTSNMTNKQLQYEIEKCLDKIEDPFQFDYHKQLYQKEVKTKGKAKLVHFLRELTDVLQNLNKDNERQ
ncbi:unnamed protein product [Mytilus coruscus]|uniref:Uncharacterized protein n=1 Tax=Mytilus coruscus TaxID=42192 RepID=A0A6J8EIT1_MYTCO|nr:unnamed protein product [Mytilus coruscus]